MAQAMNENTEITLHIIDDWHRPTAQIVRVRMATSVARSLADDLIAATTETGVLK
jgi:hypothetical protein